MFLRKAGSIMRNNPVKSALIGGGSVLGLTGILQAVSEPERATLIDQAIRAEEEMGGGQVAGVSSAALLAAAGLLGVTGFDDELPLNYSVSTSRPEYTDAYDGTAYSDPMGTSRRIDARERGIHQIRGPVPKHVIVRR